MTPQQKLKRGGIYSRILSEGWAVLAAPKPEDGPEIVEVEEELFGVINGLLEALFETPKKPELASGPFDPAETEVLKALAQKLLGQGGGEAEPPPAKPKKKKIKTHPAETPKAAPGAVGAPPPGWVPPPSEAQAGLLETTRAEHMLGTISTHSDETEATVSALKRAPVLPPKGA